MNLSAFDLRKGILSLIIISSIFAISCSKQDNEAQKQQADSLKTQDKALDSLLAPSTADTSKASLAALDIVKKNMIAHGGYSNIKNIKSLKMTLTLSGNDMSLTMKIYEIAPDKIRREVEYQNQKMITVINGKEGWGSNPETGKNEKIPADQIESIRHELMQPVEFFFSPIMSFRDKKMKMELIDKQKINEQEYYILKVTNTDTANADIMGSDVMNIWINASTFLEEKFETKMPVMGKTVPTYFLMKNFKKVENLTIPFLMESYMEDKQFSKNEINSLEINKPIDEKLFKME
jgi:hypothetical protein